jgi:basic amino acid/polyamine antiporter, APA family
MRRATPRGNVAQSPLQDGGSEVSEDAGSVTADRQTAGGPAYYTRQATGLVREISFGSNIALNVSFISLPLAVLIATQAPFAFPGASPFWVTVICAALCIFPVLMYGLFMSVMPRSGGDYVFVSRTLHPWVGFAANFNITAWYLLVIAYFGYLLAPFGFSSAFTTFGVAADSKRLVDWGTTLGTNKTWGFAIGAVTLVIVAGLMSLSLRRALQIYKVLFAISLVGIVLSILLLLIHGRGDFTGSVQRFGGNYDKVIADAHKAGYEGGATFSFKNTILAMPLAFASFGYAIVTTYAGGEVRSARSRGTRAMLASLAISAILVAAMMALASRTFGNDFLGSATFLSNNGAKEYPFASPSFFFFFVSMLTTSKLLIALISLSFIVAFIVALPATFLIATRNLFAWSFDRILPDKVSAVDERSHSPLIANVIVLIVTLIYLALIVWGSSKFLEIFFTAGMAELLTFFVVAIAAIAFPFTRRALYDGSPIKKSIAGIPVLAIVGVLALAVYVLFFYPLATNDTLGANTTTGWVATAIIAGIGILLYPISYLVNRARGVDLGLAFKQLPPE